MDVSNQKLVIRGDTVTKTGSPALMRVELEKTVRAFEIGESCGLFRVPKVLDYDDSKGIMVLERLHSIQDVEGAIAFRSGNHSLLETIATALAIVHRELLLPKDMRISLPPEFAFGGDQVFLHGDFSVRNVHIGPSWPPIVILDWQMTKVHGGKATFGTRYFDVMWFVNTLFSRPCQECFRSNPPAPAARRFLNSYLREANLPANRGELICYMKRFFAFKLAHRRKNTSWKHRLLLAYSHSVLRRFIASPHLGEDT